MTLQFTQWFRSGAVMLADTGLSGVACRYAGSVNNGELVMYSARLAWNALLPMMMQRVERQRARDSVLTILNCIIATTDKDKYKTSEVCGHCS